jgi:hypothetical protein
MAYHALNVGLASEARRSAAVAVSTPIICVHLRSSAV